MKRQIDEFRPYIGIIEAIRNPGMKERHFKELSEKIGFEIVITPELTFENLLEFDILQFDEVIREISETATKEYAIEEAMIKMRTDWEALYMEITPYKETGWFWLLKINCL